MAFAFKLLLTLFLAFFVLMCPAWPFWDKRWQLWTKIWEGFMAVSIAGVFLVAILAIWTL